MNYYKRYNLSINLFPAIFFSVESCDVERLLDGRECLKEITQVPTLKFTVKGQDAGEYIAVIDEPRGTFVVDAVYSEPPRECRVKYDIALPGRLANGSEFSFADN